MLLNACHPGKSSLSSVGVHIDFLKKKISNKSKICTHSGFTLLLRGKTYHSVSFVFRGMERILVFINLGEKPPCPWVRGEEGEGSSHPHCWLQEATDPREALTHFVSFLPSTNLNWASLNATLLSVPTFP